jgi:hypothetical protein
MTDPLYGDHQFDIHFCVRRAKAHVAKAHFAKAHFAKALATEGCGRAGRPSEPT